MMKPERRRSVSRTSTLHNAENDSRKNDGFDTTNPLKEDTSRFQSFFDVSVAPQTTGPGSPLTKPERRVSVINHSLLEMALSELAAYDTEEDSSESKDDFLYQNTACMPLVKPVRRSSVTVDDLHLSMPVRRGSTK